MADWPITASSRVQSSVPDGDMGTGVTASATANTKGAWTELIATTAATSHTILVSLSQFNANVRMLVDIGVGAPGSERAIIPNLLMALPNRTGSGVQSFPLTIPAGSRVSARVAASSGSGFAWVNVALVSGGFAAPQGFTLVADYGTVTASSRGTIVDPGAIASTKGSWSELVASAPRATRALAMRISLGGNTAPALTLFRVDVGVGAAGSEQTIIGDLVFNSSSAAAVPPTPAVWPAIPVDVPPGARLAVRASTFTTDATDRLFDVALYGLS